MTAMENNYRPIIHKLSPQTNVVLSLEEHNGQIWMGTDGGGIHILNPQTGKISTLRYIPGDRYSLPANSILVYITTKRQYVGRKCT